MSFEEPIFIVGCARSFTSLIAGTINICGVWGGEMGTPHPTNPKGFFENLDLRNLVTKPYLSRINADPRGQFPLPDPNKIKLIDLKKQIYNVLKGQDYNDELWFYKEPKLAPIWKTWNFSFPKAKWVIVRRETDSIIQSVLHTNFMNRTLNSLEGCRRWVDYHVKCFTAIKANCLSYEIWPALALKGEFSPLKQLISDLNLNWDDKIYSFIENKLVNF